MTTGDQDPTTEAIKPSWVRGERVVSNHDVTRPGGRETPCFCWADGPHAEGQEQSLLPGETP